MKAGNLIDKGLFNVKDNVIGKERIMKTLNLVRISVINKQSLKLLLDVLKQ